VARIAGLKSSWGNETATNETATKDDSMPIDLSAVDWVYVGVLAVLAFFATVVGNLLSFNHRGIAAFLAALVFAALFVAWTYYPHGLPLPIRLAP
jgi:hypothetical protein